MNSDSQELFDLLCDRMEKDEDELWQEIRSRGVSFDLHLAKDICDDFQIVRISQSKATTLHMFCEELPIQEEVHDFLVLYLSHWDTKT